MSDFGTTTQIKSARKEHTFRGCDSKILKGTSYEYWAGMVDGDFYTAKICPECVQLRDLLDAQGWDYREYPMNLQEAAEEYSSGDPWGFAKGRSCAIISELPQLVRLANDGRWVVREVESA